MLILSIGGRGCNMRWQITYLAWSLAKLPSDVEDVLLDAALFAISNAPVSQYVDANLELESIPWSWYEEMFCFISTGTMPPHLSRDQRKRLALWSRNFEVNLGQLYHKNVADALQRCVLPHEHDVVLTEAHAGVSSGHFFGTARKVGGHTSMQMLCSS